MVMTITTTPVRPMRSLLAFTHGVNGRRDGEAASAAALLPAAGDRLHAQRDQESNPSHGNAVAAVRVGADRETAKGEL
jgi:hypothetical protein